MDNFVQVRRETYKIYHYFAHYTGYFPGNYINDSVLD